MRKTKVILGILISIFFLWMTFKDINLQQLLKSFEYVNYMYVIIAIAVVLFAYAVRALRWRELLLPVKKLSFINVYKITVISFMFIMVFPVRLGELSRLYLMKKKNQISNASTLSTIVMERILDGCSSMFLFFIGIYFYPQNVIINIGQTNLHIKTMLLVLFIIYLLGLLLLIYIKIYPKKLLFIVNFIFNRIIYKISVLKNIFTPIHEKIIQIIDNFIKGMKFLGDWKQVVTIFFYSILVWFLITMGFYLVILAFGFDLKFYISFIIMGFSVFGTMIPAAPGLLGTLHYSIVIAFLYFTNISRVEAVSYSWIRWFITVVPIILVGLYYFNKENISIKEEIEEIKTYN